MTKELFFAQEGSVTIGSTNYTQEVKEIRIGGMERPVEQIRTWGQGAFEQLTPAQIGEMTITTKKEDADIAVYHLGGVAATTNPGSVLEEFPHTPQTVQYDWKDPTVGSEHLQIKVASAYMTGRELSLGTDNHLEEVTNWKFLPKYYKEGFTPDATGSPLSL